MIDYGYIKEVKLELDTAEKKITEALKKEGFGVLTRIDVQKKFKEALDLTYKKYIILGVCNPPSAYKALEAEENIGLLLPCNVVLYEKDRVTCVAVIKPTIALSLVNNPALEGFAEEIEKKLIAAADSLLM